MINEYEDSKIVQFVSKYIDERSSEFYYEINKFLHDNPELAYHEFKAHERLTSFIEKQDGWTVEKSAYGISTAFVAIFRYEDTPETPTISFNAEYDALPDIGHACGHNLIATGAIAAAMAAACSMQKYKIAGSIKLFGTPAEEGGGGKVKLVEAGAYENVHISLMQHGSNVAPGFIYLHTAATLKYHLEYFGKGAHAAVAPWEGVNALDASSIFLHAVATHRQHFKEGDVIQNIIKNGGKVANIIPDFSLIQGNIRARNLKRLGELESKLSDCVKAGALATGCTYKFYKDTQYDDMIPSAPLSEILRSYYNRLLENDGSTERLLTLKDEKKMEMPGSTDEGTVSWRVPSVQFQFYVPCEKTPHTIEFAAAASTKNAHNRCLKAAKGLALTGLKVLSDSELLSNIMADHKKMTSTLIDDMNNDIVKQVL